MIAKLSQTNSPDETPVYEFYTEYVTQDANGNDVTLLQKEGENSVKELQDRITNCNERLNAIITLE